MLHLQSLQSLHLHPMDCQTRTWRRCYACALPGIVWYCLILSGAARFLERGGRVGPPAAMPVWLAVSYDGLLRDKHAGRRHGLAAACL